ncbi:hypothetical protein GCM10027425_14980 [Alteromonas gracilis]
MRRHREEATSITDAHRSFEDRQRTRQRRYFAIMGTCFTLIGLSWFVVRLHSTAWAVGMTLVAMVLPPIAAFVANRGADRLD